MRTPSTTTSNVLPLQRPVPASPVPSLARISDRLRAHALEILDDDALTRRDAHEAWYLLGLARDIASRPRIVRFLEQSGAAR